MREKLADFVKRNKEDVWENEDGGVAEFIIVTVIIVGCAVFVLGKIGGAIKNKGNEATNIINGAKFN